VSYVVRLGVDIHLDHPNIRVVGMAGHPLRTDEDFGMRVFGHDFLLNDLL
jgi:hypothetical protein